MSAPRTLPRDATRAEERRLTSGRRSGERRVVSISIDDERRQHARRSGERREGTRGHLRRAILQLQQLHVSGSLRPREGERVHAALRHLWCVLKEIELPHV
jgi:hypothetical protein